MNYEGVYTDEKNGEMSFYMRGQNDEEIGELTTMLERGVKIERVNGNKVRFYSPKPAKKQAQRKSAATSTDSNVES